MLSPSKILICFLAGVFVPGSALATNKIGNGGNAVVCGDLKTSEATAKLLDFYEGDFVPPLPAGKSEFEIAKVVFEKLQTAAPALASQYSRRLEELKSEIDYKSGVILTDTKDSDHLFKPEEAGCDVVQTAIRRNGETAGQKRFLFRKDVWEKMKASDRAGLLAHEILYEHFSKLGLSTSTKARQVNLYLFREEKIEASAFWKLMRNLEIPIYP